MSLLPKDPRDREYMILGLRIAVDFGASIAAPVVVFVLAGQWLDRRYDISPWATIGAFVVAALISGRIVYKKAKRYGRMYESLGNKDESVQNGSSDKVIK